MAVQIRVGPSLVFKIPERSVPANVIVQDNNWQAGGAEQSHFESCWGICRESSLVPKRAAKVFLAWVSSRKNTCIETGQHFHVHLWGQFDKMGIQTVVFRGFT